MSQILLVFSSRHTNSYSLHYFNPVIALLRLVDASIWKCPSIVPLQSTLWFFSVSTFVNVMKGHQPSGGVRSSFTKYSGHNFQKTYFALFLSWWSSRMNVIKFFEWRLCILLQDHVGWTNNKAVMYRIVFMTWPAGPAMIYHCCCCRYIRQISKWDQLWFMVVVVIVISDKYPNVSL